MSHETRSPGKGSGKNVRRSNNQGVNRSQSNGRDGSRDRAKLAVALGIAALVAVILLIWGIAGRHTGRDSPAQTTDSGTGTTILAGGEENSQAGDGQEPQGSGAQTGGEDPQPHDATLPDGGTGAEAALDGSGIQPDDEITLGIDVSKWQGKIDWQQVAESGVEFAMVRVGYRAGDTGAIFADPYAAYNLQHADEAGIRLGAYFFSTAVTAEEAVEEANWTADFLAGYPITYPVAYNCEGFQSSDSRMYGISAGERTANALSFLQAIADRGYQPLFYASRYELSSEPLWDVADIEEKSAVWIAHYPSAPYPETENPSYTGSYVMWQYTSQGNVPGIPAYVDLNVAYLKYEETARPQSPGAAGEAGDVPFDSSFQAVNEPVTAKELTNLRDYPSTYDSKVIATLSYGQWATRTGISPGGWSRLDYEEQTVYALSSLLLTEAGSEAAENSAPTETASSVVYQAVNEQVTAKIETNLRDRAGSDGSQVVATIYNGDWVTRTGIGANGWSRLEYNGQTVYARTSYLTTNPDYDPDNVDDKDIYYTPADDTMTAKDTTNLRDKPSAEGSLIATIHYGDIVVRTGIGSNGWDRVVYEGQTLYAVSSYLTPYDGD